MLAASEAAVTFAVSHGLPVMFVTEDTTRARPETECHSVLTRAGS